MQVTEQFRKRLNEGELVWGTFMLESAATGLVTILANAGLDFIIIDGEHGTYDVSQIRTLVEAAGAAGIAPIVRVPVGDRGMATKVLDSGANGILFPQATTMEHVHQAVEVSKYPPMGRRGVHLFRPHTDFDTPTDFAAFFERTNRSSITGVMIETVEAAALVDSIAATDGVDMIYVGPTDLGANIDAAESTDFTVEQVIADVAEACKRHGKIAGIQCVHDMIPGVTAQGYRLLSYGAEARLLLEGAWAFLEQARGAVALPDSPDR